MNRREEEDASTGELHTRHLQDHRAGFNHEDDADQRKEQDVPCHKACHCERGPESECPGIANDHTRRMDVEPEEADERSGDERADDGNVQLPWRIQECDHHVADPGEDHRSARESIKSVGEINAVTRSDDCHYGDGDPQDRRDRHLTNEWDNE